MMRREAVFSSLQVMSTLRRPWSVNAFSNSSAHCRVPNPFRRNDGRMV